MILSQCILEVNLFVDSFSLFCSRDECGHLLGRREGQLGEARERQLTLVHRDGGYTLGSGSHLERIEEPVQGGLLGVHDEHVEPCRCIQVYLSDVIGPLSKILNVEVDTDTRGTGSANFTQKLFTLRC